MLDPASATELLTMEHDAVPFEGRIVHVEDQRQELAGNDDIQPPSYQHNLEQAHWARKAP